MPRVIIPLNNLPYPGEDGKHKVRFRITTKDYNEISEWSPIFLLDSPLQQSAGSASYIYNITEITPGEKTITLSWEDIMPITNVENHDIFVAWNENEEYQFYKRNVGNSIIINKIPDATHIRIKVQVPSYPMPPKENSIYVLFETENIAW